MLAEFLTWLVTPASRQARRMGHLAESIAITARERRCRAAWAPHLAASRAALLASARACARRRVALVLGSGPLFDVPLAELSALFESVWLVDIVQPLRARRLVRRFGNVLLIEHDITESMECFPAVPMPPRRFLDEPDIDWVASVNLLSQLPTLPLRRLGWTEEWTEERRQGYAEALMTNHLDYLARFAAPVCRVCLIADLEQSVRDGAGRLVERRDYRPLLGGWRLESEWDWELSPAGELAGGGSALSRVAALSRPTSAGSAGPRSG